MTSAADGVGERCQARPGPGRRRPAAPGTRRRTARPGPARRAAARRAPPGRRRPARWSARRARPSCGRAARTSRRRRRRSRCAGRRCARRCRPRRAGRPGPTTSTTRPAPATAGPTGIRPSTASPSGPASAATCGRTRGSSHGSGCSTYGGWAASRSRSSKPASALSAASLSMFGHGRSGLTWSGVSGETPPQSSTPARSSRPSSVESDRFGGACTRAFGPEQQPGDGDRGDVLLQLQVVVGLHRRPRLGPEVLDDDLLHVPVPLRRRPGSRRTASTRSA